VRNALNIISKQLLMFQGPDAFWQAQNEVSSVLEESHYPSFILSDIYHQYIMNYDEDDGATASKPTLANSSPMCSRDFSEKASMRTRRITLHSNYAQEKLQQLEDKINNKTQALKALKSQKAEPKV
jgi:sorting nexin-25